MVGETKTTRNKGCTKLTVVEKLLDRLHNSNENKVNSVALNSKRYYYYYMCLADYLLK